MKKLIVVFFVLFSCGLFAQEVNKVVIDPDLKSDVLIGRCNREGLKSAPFKAYFDTVYAKYSADEIIMKQLKKKLDGAKILIVMGTWCEDSQEQVPAFYKVLDVMKFVRLSVSYYT
jgi:hypothetical protein